MQGLEEASAVQADQVSGTHRGRNVDLVSAVEGNVSVSIKYTFCRQLFAVARRNHFDRDPVGSGQNNAAVVEGVRTDGREHDQPCLWLDNGAARRHAVGG